jgi:hypothetical protein
VPISSIGDIPFVERELLELLALDRDRDAPDLDYAGFGWAFAPHVVLEDGVRREIADPIVVAMHSADEQTTDGDIDLLFETDDESVIVPLSRFLPHAFRLLPADREIVLALCNPAKVRPDPVDRVVHYADGDVLSWLDPIGRHDWIVRLSAPVWHTLGATHGAR